MERRQLGRGRPPLRGGVGQVVLLTRCRQAAFALPVVLVVTGCGGRSAPSVAARADAICREQNRKIAALPHATTLAQQQDNYDRRVKIVRATLRRLRGLDPSLRGLIVAVDAELEAAEELRVASLSDDLEGEEGATFRVQKAARQALRRARELGLTVCGRPPPGS